MWFYAALAGVLSLRLGLVMLPAPGRDEATYAWWAQHGEPGYSLLLQLFVRAATVFPLPEMAALRAPAFLCGVLVLYLFNRVLGAAGWYERERRLAVLALAFTPWQTYAGSILHPDALFMALVLLVSLAAWEKRPWLLMMALGFSIWAKPTGWLVAGAGCFTVLTLSEWKSRGKWITAGVAVLSLPNGLAVNRPMLEAMSEFGRVSASLGSVLVLAVVTLVVMGGLYLPVQAWRSLLEAKWRGRGAGTGAFSWWTGLLLVLAFGMAVVMRHQFKANWILVALVILAPLSRGSGIRRLGQISVGLSAVLSALMVWGFHFPGSVAAVESKAEFLRSSYGVHAGIREERVSVTRSWSGRVLEYHSQDVFLAAVNSFWFTEGEDAPPQWIVSDDYGLAAQVAFQWREKSPVLVIPSDGLFHRWNEYSEEHMSGRILVLGVHQGVSAVEPRLPEMDAIRSVIHPISGSTVELGRVSMPTPANPREK